MSEIIPFNLALDLFPLLASLLVVVTCGLLGNFLVLRRESMMGDAISHAVLPGLVIGLAVTSSVGAVVMLIGAAIAGFVAVLLIEAVKRLGNVEPGAAMGVVFSVMFALGVLMLEIVAAGNVHVDPDTVLYGQLETLIWFEAPPSWSGLWAWSTVTALPRQIWTLGILGILSLGFVWLFFKELRLTAFDPALATTQGISAWVMHLALMLLVAAATVASFEAVGSILVIAMLIAPAATARLLTDRLLSQVLVSVLIAMITAIGGYLGATAVPALFDADSVNAAGSMTVVAGLLVILAALLSPSHGVIARWRRQKQLSQQTLTDDLLATLQHISTLSQAPVPIQSVASYPSSALQRAQRSGYIHISNDLIVLTASGHDHISQTTSPEQQIS